MGRRSKTKKEKVLDFLLTHPGEVVSKDQIAAAADLIYSDYASMMVSALKKEGYQIESVRDPERKRAILGYKLLSPEKCVRVETKPISFSTRLTQLFLLAEEIPKEEEAAFALRQIIIENLFPLLRQVLGVTDLTIEFPTDRGIYSLRGSKGWQYNGHVTWTQSDWMAERLDFPTLQKGLEEGAEKMIASFVERGETASAEKAKLVRLLRCLEELRD